jgi:multidrug resistance efflux pump
VDIQRDRPTNRKRYVAAGAVAVLLIGATAGLDSLRPAQTSLDRTILAIDTVSFGELVREVRAPGTLVADHVRLVIAVTGGRVEGLPIPLGASVAPGTIVVRLSNGDVELGALQVQQQLTQAHTSLAQLRTRLAQDRMSQQSLLAQLRTQRLDAERAARVLDSLDRRGLASRNELAGAQEKAQEFAVRSALEKHRLEEMRTSAAEQVRLAGQQVAGLEQILAEQRRRVSSLQVVAGEAGELQSLGSPKLELGSWVNSGTELARVSQPGRLKAVLRVPESQAKEIIPGQHASVDTHDGVVRGHVTSVDPLTRGGAVSVELELDEALPKGARADLGVEGSIEIERLPSLLRVGRPAYGRAGTIVRLFRIVPNSGEAERVDVRLGRTSVMMVEVLQGLARGDSVIVSDMSPYITDSRVHLRGT